MPGVQLFSQQNFNADSLFVEAKERAKRDDYATACELLNTILTHKEDGDVRLYLGLLYSWNGKYGDARRELNLVQEARPTSGEVTLARINVEMWSDNPAAALVIINKALASSPDDQDLQYRKAQALDKLQKPRDAIGVLDTLLAKHPENKKARDLRDAIRLENARNKVSASYGTEFVQDQENWHLASLQYSRKTRRGSVLGRVNYARRFGMHGVQGEVDAYPKTGKTNYAYLNFGYSDAAVFPRYRYGFEFYQGLPWAFEASLGFRYLVFSSSNVMIYTGSVGKYWGSFWFSLRPFITPSKGYSPSVTGLIIVRRYFATADDYVGVQVGHGSSPDDIHQYLEKTERLSSNKVKLSVSKRFAVFWVVGASVSYEKEEIYPEPPTYRDRYSIDIGIQRQF